MSKLLKGRQLVSPPASPIRLQFSAWVVAAYICILVEKLAKTFYDSRKICFFYDTRKPVTGDGLQPVQLTTLIWKMQEYLLMESIRDFLKIILRKTLFQDQA